MKSLQSEWVVGGDFNVVMDPAERVGVSYNLGHISSFKNFVLKANIIDIPMQGSLFTWSNNKIC